MGTAIGRMTSTNKEFSLREYDALQSKMRHAVDDLSRTETIVPIAVSALYAWFAKDGRSITTETPWVYLLPTVLAILGLLRQEARYAYIRISEEYVRRIEQAIYGHVSIDRIPGWETFYHSRPIAGHRLMRVLFWSGLTLFSAAFAYYKICVAGK